MDNVLGGSSMYKVKSLSSLKVSEDHLEISIKIKVQSQCSTSRFFI